MASDQNCTAELPQRHLQNHLTRLVTAGAWSCCDQITATVRLLLNHSFKAFALSVVKVHTLFVFGCLIDSMYRDQELSSYC